MAAKYLVRVRALTRPTSLYDRSGWRDAVCWTPWKTVARFDTYEVAAEEARSDRYRTGLQRAVVFYRGKVIWRHLASDGSLVKEYDGVYALNRWRA